MKVRTWPSAPSETRGVGAHVGDEAHGAAPPDPLAFVEPLGDLHGAADRESQPSRRRLLELRGNERRRRGLSPLRLLHFPDHPASLLHLAPDLFGPAALRNLRIRPVELELLA